MSENRYYIDGEWGLWCHDCNDFVRNDGREVVIDGVIYIPAEAFLGAVGMITGPLFEKAKNHHNVNRPPTENEPQHNTFTVKGESNERILGTFTTPSMVTEVSFSVQDEQIRDDIYKHVKETSTIW